MTTTDGIYTQTVVLDVDIEDYMFGNGEYTYQVNAVTAAGVQQGSWQTTNNTEPFVQLSN